MAALLSSSSSPLASAPRSAVKTLDFFAGVLHLDNRKNRRTLSSSATASASASASAAGDYLLSRFLRILTHFCKPPNANPPPPPPATPPTPDPDHALLLLRDLQRSGARPTLYNFCTAISALVSAARYRDAQSLFEEMISSGLTPNASTLTLLVKMYSVHLKQFDSASAVIGWMVRWGCEPNAATYSTLINGLCRAGKIDEVWAVLDHMLKEKCTPTFHTFTPIIQAYCAEGRVEEAKRFVDWVERIGCPLGAISYTILINALCKAGDFDGAENVLSESELNGWTPDEYSYNTFISGLCKAGKDEEAFKQLEVMLERGLSPDVVTLNIVIDCLCKVSKVWEMKALLERSAKLGIEVDVVNYNTVMSWLCRNKKWSAVMKMFTDMLKKGVEPDVWTYDVLICSLCRAGEFRKAECIVRSEGFVADVVTCNILIHEFYKVGKVTELQRLLSEMDLENVVFDMVTYNTMVDGLCKNRKFYEAIGLVRSVDNDFRPELVAHLTYGLITGGRIGEALSILEEMLQRDMVVECHIFHYLIKAFCRKGYCKTNEVDAMCLILDMMLGIG